MVQVGYSDVSSAIYEGMRHEVLNEINKKVVWEDILNHINNWLSACMRYNSLAICDNNEKSVNFESFIKTVDEQDKKII